MSNSETPQSTPNSPDRTVTPPDILPPSATATGSGGPRRRRSWRGLLLLLVVVASICGLAYWWWQTRIDVTTDNAYVVGNITPIASRVSGQVVTLFIDDNMIVQPGDPIAQIDPVPFQMQVDQALADYKQAGYDADAADVMVHYTTDERKSFLEGARARRDEAEQAINAAEIGVRTHRELLQKDENLLASLKDQLPGLVALRDNARFYYERFKSLAATGDIPIQEKDNREAAFREAEAKLASLRSNILAAERQVQASAYQLNESEVRLTQSRRMKDNTQASVGQAVAAQLQPQVATNTAAALRNKKLQAEAKLQLAILNLSNTLIRAPQAGIISRRTIQLGQTVEANKPFLSIVPLDLDNVWVIANMREEQMARVRVGQAVTIVVDAISDRTFEGWVESVAGGTGSVFSLFPPDNATGNFVRVVQRLSIRVRFSDKENDQNRIRPGLSSRIRIDTNRYVRTSRHKW
jgi:membrane fusion protein (multidrug efflux system)